MRTTRPAGLLKGRLGNHWMARLRSRVSESPDRSDIGTGLKAVDADAPICPRPAPKAASAGRVSGGD